MRRRRGEAAERDTEMEENYKKKKKAAAVPRIAAVYSDFPAGGWNGVVAAA